MQKRRIHWKVQLFIYPAVLYMLVFVGYPLVYNIVIAFRDVNLSNVNTGQHHFIGLQNYREVFQQEIFWVAIKNTFLFTIGSVVFQLIFGFMLALLFNLKFRLASLLRGLMMVGWLIPITISALLFKFLMDSNLGVINYLLKTTGLVDKPVEWLTNPEVALWSVIIANIWIGIPFNMLLLSTGLASLPEDVYESASMDGANRIQRFLYITVPMLKPVITVVMMLGFIYTFKVFDLIYVMTGGGPINSTELLSMLAYRYSFSQFNFGLGSAVANILFILLFIVSLVYIRMINKDEVM
jgi:multiple sugar transport system permease protein